MSVIFKTLQKLNEQSAGGDTKRKRTKKDPQTYSFRKVLFSPVTIFAGLFFVFLTCLCAVYGVSYFGNVGSKNTDYISSKDPADKKQVGIEIHSGKNRIIRRMFEHLGYRIMKLDRVYFAGLTKKGLARGEWRYLKEKEIIMLKTGKYN